MNADNLIWLQTQGIELEIFRAEDGEIKMTITRACDEQDEGPSQDFSVNVDTLRVSGIYNPGEEPAVEMEKALELAKETAGAVEHLGHTASYVEQCLAEARQLVLDGKTPDGSHSDATASYWCKLK